MRSLIGLAHGRGGHAIPNQNLILNGSFLTHVDGWYPVENGQEITWDNGEMVVTATDVGRTNSRIAWSPSAVETIAFPPDTDLVVSAVAKSNEVDPTVRFFLTFLETDIFNVDASELNISIPDSSGEPISNVWTPIVGTILADEDLTPNTRVRIALVGPKNVRYDNIYIGPVGGNVPPYPDATVPPLGERVSNGTFETNILDWDGWSGGETRSRETIAPITGTGSLKCVTPGNDAGEGLYTPIHNGFIVVPGESLRVRLKIVGIGAGDIKLVLYSASGETTIWEGAPSTNVNSPTVIDETIVVPSTDNVVQTAILTSTMQATTFWVDDYSLVAVP